MTIFDTNKDSAYPSEFYGVGCHVVKKITIDKDNIEFLCEDGATFTVETCRYNDFLVSREDKQTCYDIEIMGDKGIIELFIEKYRC